MKIVITPYAGAGKAVFVHGYTRFRFGKLEWVTQHYRSWPQH